MRGASTIRRIGGAVVLAAAFAGAGAGPAMAAIQPACHTRLVAAEYDTAASCNFDTHYDYARIDVVTDGTVLVTLRCNSQYGYNYVTSRTVTGNTNYRAYTPGGCQLVLTSKQTGTTAFASATPTTPPIIEPYPYPVP